MCSAHSTSSNAAAVLAAGVVPALVLAISKDDASAQLREHATEALARVAHSTQGAKAVVAAGSQRVNS